MRLSDKLMPYIVLGLLVYGLCLGTVYVYYLLTEDNQKTIQFEVVGIINDTNATTLVQIHFECIKYCVDSRANTEKCWEQCASLGKE